MPSQLWLIKQKRLIHPNYRTPPDYLEFDEEYEAVFADSSQEAWEKICVYWQQAIESPFVDDRFTPLLNAAWEDRADEDKVIVRKFIGRLRDGVSNDSFWSIEIHKLRVADLNLFTKKDMNNRAMDPNETTAASIEDIKGIDFEKLNKDTQEFEEYEKRLRKLYLDHPDRKTFFNLDIAESIWREAFDNFEVMLDDDAVADILDLLFEEPFLSFAIQDAFHEYEKREKKNIFNFLYLCPTPPNKTNYQQNIVLPKK